MIKFEKIILIILILIISSCTSLDSLKQSYKNFLPLTSNDYYIVQPGDSIWSIALNLNLDTELLIKNNNLKMPYVIHPNQKLLLSGRLTKNNFNNKSEVMKWHHPLGKKSKMAVKDGAWLIFKESKGAPIHSINAGRVVVSGPDIPGYGNLVMISHSDGYLSLYAHCDQILVEIGEDVVRGAKIARLGNSEAAYPMLKFQLRRNGVPLSSKSLELFF